MGAKKKVEQKTKKKGFAFRSNGPFDGLSDYQDSDIMKFQRIDAHSSMGQVTAFLNGEENDPAPVYVFQGDKKIPFTQSTIRGKMGLFYELAAQAIYSGQRRNNYTIGPQGNQLNVQPDLMKRSIEDNVIRDSKSVLITNTLKMTNSQFIKYAYIQRMDLKKENPLLFFGDPLITYEIFRHGVDTPEKTYTGLPGKDLFDAMAKKTRFLASIPFSVAQAIHERRGDQNATNEYHEEITREYDCVTLNKSYLDLLISDPEAFLKTFELNPKDYIISKNRSPPRSFKMMGTSVSSFPILTFRDKDHSKWVKGFKSDFGEIYAKKFYERWEKEEAKKDELRRIKEETKKQEMELSLNPSLEEVVQEDLFGSPPTEEVPF